MPQQTDASIYEILTLVGALIAAIGPLIWKLIQIGIEKRRRRAETGKVDAEAIQAEAEAGKAQAEAASVWAQISADAAARLDDLDDKLTKSEKDRAELRKDLEKAEKDGHLRKQKIQALVRTNVDLGKQVTILSLKIADLSTQVTVQGTRILQLEDELAATKKERDVLVKRLKELENDG